MKLTKNFSLSEMIKTNTGFDNTPNKEQICRLRVLCEKIMQPLRNWYGKPIIITSGFRNGKVNNAVGGVYGSQHTMGEACDFSGGNRSINKKLHDYIKDNLEFDQLINEYDYQWIHVSYTTRRPNRKQTLVIK